MSGRCRVALDVHALQVEGLAERGIGRYVAGYAAALASAGRVASALLAPELPPPAGVPAGLVEARLLHWDGMAEVRRILDGDGPLAYHVTAPFTHSEPLAAPVLGVAPHWAEAGLPRVTTLHDLIPLRAPRHYLPSQAHLDRYRARAAWVASSDLIVTNSAYTRREAIELLGCDEDRVVEVGAGVSGFFSPTDGTDDELWALHLPEVGDRPFLLTVAGSDWRKGTERVMAALGRLADRHPDLWLVVVGDLTEQWRVRLGQAAGGYGVDDRVVFAGAVSDELLRAAYRRAVVTVMASLAEGAGLPVLEAAASGCPALASDSSALAETAGTPLALFDPTDTDSVAESIAALLDDDQRRAGILAEQQQLARTSTWEAVAEKAGAALDRLAVGDRSASGRRQPPVRKVARQPPVRKVALVGPVAPDGGGIGAYNQRLLTASDPAGAVRLDAVSASPSRPELPAHVGYVCSDAFGTDARPCSYDQVVYTLGNSDGHLSTVGLLLAHPGWVWLHETRLPAIATTALAGESDEAFGPAMAALLSRAYPGRPPLAAARRAGRSHIDLVAAGVGLLAPLVERCAGILVNSELARYMVELDLAPLAARPPVVVLPPACPPVRSRPADGGDGRVVAFGVVSASKRPEILVDAAAEGGWPLSFVGPCPDVLRQFIEERAARRGASGQVEVVGAVDEAEWSGWLDRAALAVQLRGSLSGETSAAVLEALACGVPVLTNLATAGEYPAGTVAMISDPTPRSLAAAVGDLLGSDSERSRLARAGHDFASAHQFPALFEALLSAIDQPLRSLGP